MTGTGPPRWRTPAQAIQLVARGRTARAAAPVAAVVGTLLSLVNEGSALVAGTLPPVVLVRIAVNYAVPFVVASTGYLMASRLPPESPAEVRTPVAEETRGS